MGTLSSPAAPHCTTHYTASHSLPFGQKGTRTCVGGRAPALPPPYPTPRTPSLPTLAHAGQKKRTLQAGGHTCATTHCLQHLHTTKALVDLPLRHSRTVAGTSLLHRTTALRTLARYRHARHTTHTPRTHTRTLRAREDCHYYTCTPRGHPHTAAFRQTGTCSAGGWAKRTFCRQTSLRTVFLRARCAPSWGRNRWEGDRRSFYGLKFPRQCTVAQQRLDRLTSYLYTSTMFPLTHHHSPPAFSLTSHGWATMPPLCLYHLVHGPF